MRVAGLITTFVLLACGGSKSAPSAPPPGPGSGSATVSADARAKCAAAIAEAAKTGREGEEFSAEDQKLNAEVEATMTEGCAATAWSEHVLQCLTNGTSRDELRLCTEKLLTDAQREDFMERVLAVMKKHEAAAKPAP